ncbi:MAG TPA: GNAT family N-acetyltransferase [Thermoplasmataceae archaeon]|nr:GNAT family N-acetyltransferase [Thermoplasmataceae archaeon]
MEIQNIKMDWNLILEPQIRHYEEVYYDLPVRDSMRTIISQLNENRIPSRVILSSLEVAGYAFVINSSEMSDRSFGSIGFADEKYVNERRMETLVGWVEQIAFGNRRMAMVNPIFNDRGLSDRFLDNRGYSKRVRKKLTLKIKNANLSQEKLPTEIKVLDLSHIDLAEYSRSHYEAFRNSLDEIMFPSSDQERNAQIRKMFDGYYGEPIYEACKILSKNNRIIGAIIVTQGQIRKTGIRIPLIADLFVSPEFRGNGLGQWLIGAAIEALEKLGFTETELWVTDGNPAESMYKRFGFRDTNYPREIFHFRTG